MRGYWNMHDWNNKRGNNEPITSSLNSFWTLIAQTNQIKQKAIIVAYIHIDLLDWKTVKSRQVNRIVKKTKKFVIGYSEQPNSDDY